MNVYSVEAGLYMCAYKCMALPTCVDTMYLCGTYDPLYVHGPLHMPLLFMLAMLSAIYMYMYVCREVGGLFVSYCPMCAFVRCIIKGGERTKKVGRGSNLW